MVPPGDDDKYFRNRRREREEEDKEDTSFVKKTAVPSRPGPSSDRFEDLLERAEPMIEQLNNLYQMYITGAEKHPPLEKRKQLDQLIVTLTSMPKPTPATQFRYNSVFSNYQAHVDRWEKLLKDLESGKIKRITGPNRGR